MLTTPRARRHVGARANTLPAPTTTNHAPKTVAPPSLPQFDSAAFHFKFLPFTLPYPVPFRLLGDERKARARAQPLFARARGGRGGCRGSGQQRLRGSTAR